MENLMNVNYVCTRLNAIEENYLRIINYLKHFLFNTLSAAQTSLILNIYANITGEKIKFKPIYDFYLYKM